MIRKLIDDGLKIEVVKQDIDGVSEVIKHQIENIAFKPINRLVSILIKIVKSTEANKHVTYSLLKEISRKNTDEIIEIAEAKAVEYAKRNAKDVMNESE